MRFPSVPRKKTAPRTSEGAPVPEGPRGPSAFLWERSPLSNRRGRREKTIVYRLEIKFTICPYHSNTLVIILR